MYDTKKKEIRTTWFLVLLVGISLAIRLPDISRSLWMDEAWVANSLLSNSPRQWFFYDAWAQSTPPLFIVISRAARWIFGTSNTSFRIVPLVFSIIAILLFLLYARRIFSPLLSLLSTTVFAFAPAFCIYSQELKQYTCDLAVAVAILLTLWSYASDHWGRGRGYWATMTLFAISPFLSYTSVMYLPLAFLVVALVERNLQRIAGFAACSTSAFLTCYLLFIRPNEVQQLWSFFRLNFPSSFSFSELPSYYWREDSELMQVLVPEGLEHFALVILGVSILITLLGCLRQSSPRRIRIFLFSVIPWLSLIAANALGRYPLGVARLNLFLLPSIVVLPTLALELLAEHAPSSWVPAAQQQFMLYALFSLMVLSGSGIGYKMFHRQYTNWEDSDSAIVHIWSTAQPNDQIFVHASFSEQVKLYVTLKRLPARQITFGDTGWPCCPRDKRFELTNSDPGYFAADLGEKLRARGVIWFLATARPSHWRALRRNEPDSVRHLLVEHGCTVTSNPSFYNVAVYRFDCR